jgi:hypothetical protein
VSFWSESLNAVSKTITRDRDRVVIRVASDGNSLDIKDNHPPDEKEASKSLDIAENEVERE